MTERAETKVETYSRGMLQRLGIADALVKDPVGPHPRRADDRRSTRSASIEILDLLRGLVRERGLAVLLSSHLLSQVQSVCDRVGIFAAGQLIGVGTVEELAAAVRRERRRTSRSGSRAPTAEERKAIQKRLGEIKGVDEVRSHRLGRASRSCSSRSRQPHGPCARRPSRSRPRPGSG